VDRQEQIGAGAVGNRRALLELDELVGVAGERDFDARLLLEQIAQAEGHVQHELRLVHAIAASAGVVAAMPGIEDDA